MMHSSRGGKIFLGLMLGMIGIRLSMFALGMMGVITFAGPMDDSIISWILPVGMPLVMIVLMLAFRRRQMMRQRMTHTSDDATLTASTTPQLFPPMMAMQHLLSRKSHKKRNIAIVASIVVFMVSMHILSLGGVIIQGAMAPYGIIVILAFMAVMFVVHSRMSKRKPGAVPTPASPKK